MAEWPGCRGSQFVSLGGKDKMGHCPVRCPGFHIGIAVPEKTKMTFFDSGSQPYFCANSSTHGANKKIPRPLVACFPGFNCSPDFCDCHTLGMADPDPALPDYGVSESDGYHVE